MVLTNRNDSICNLMKSIWKYNRKRFSDSFDNDRQIHNSPTYHCSCKCNFSVLLRYPAPIWAVHMQQWLVAISKTETEAADRTACSLIFSRHLVKILEHNCATVHCYGKFSQPFLYQFWPNEWESLGNWWQCYCRFAQQTKCNWEWKWLMRKWSNVYSFGEHYWIRCKIFVRSRHSIRLISAKWKSFSDDLSSSSSKTLWKVCFSRTFILANSSFRSPSLFFIDTIPSVGSRECVAHSCVQSNKIYRKNDNLFRRCIQVSSQTFTSSESL